METNQTKWTQFWDMHSGGGQKEQWSKIYIEAPEAEAKVIFQNRFGHNPERVSCTCCGEDYAASECESLEQSSAYHRGCAYEDGKYVEKPDTGNSYKKYQTVEQYAADKDVLIIRADEIKDSERVGELRQSGYVWQD